MYWHTLARARPKYEAYIELLHRVLVHELRDATMDLVTDRIISTVQLNSADKINELLLPKHPVSKELAKAIFEDENYGLGSQHNFPEWHALIPGKSSPLEHLAWEWELKTYFGLSHAQITELAKNWSKL